MTARTHDAIAFASLVTIASFYPPPGLNIPTIFAALVANIVGSLLPDMDQASNRLWDLLPAGDYLGKVFRRLFLGHRSISHSILGAYLFYKFLGFILPMILNSAYIYPQVVFDAMMIGYISHLLADSLTREGIPLLFPLKINIGFPPLKFLRIRTGSWVENLVVLPGTGMYLFWFIGKNQDRLLTIVKELTK